MSKSQTLKKLTPIFLGTCLLVACSSTPNKSVTNQPISLEQATLSAQSYLSQAKDTNSKLRRDKLTLLAAKAQLNDNQIEAAEDLLQGLTHTLSSTPTVQAEYRHLSAKILIKRKQFDEALEVLKFQSQWQLPVWQWRAYYQSRAWLFAQLQQPLNQIAELSLLSKFVDKQEATQINNNIWGLLRPIPQDQLAELAQNATEPLYAGWLQLAYIAKHYGADPNQLVSYLGRWQRQHRDHPAALKLPSDLEKALNTKPYHPKKIAVLLPLSGDKGEIANPVRVGILSRYLKAPEDNAQLEFYDTSKDPIEAYQHALAEGAEFIIGPLLPNNLNKLKQYQQQNPSTVPQLYLNQLEQFTPNDNQYYFSLSPQQEAIDAAMHMFRDGIKSPLIFASNNNIGHRMAAAFNQEWQTLTEEPAEIHFYDGGDKMKLTVQQAMGVTDSKARIARMKALLGRKLKADFRSRQDIDAIYMIASARDLPLLKPFIDVNFSVFTKPVPLYTTSRSRPNGDIRRSTPEYDGVTISEAPWLMQNTPDNRTVDKLWPTWNNGQQRLYAMGFDALELVGKLAQMRAFPGFHFKGDSGLLSVDENGVIDRQLQWGKYRRGYLLPL